VILYRLRVEFQLPANRYEKLISPNAVEILERETPVSRRAVHQTSMTRLRSAASRQRSLRMCSTGTCVEDR
jgi:hypothetical protein